jgi:uncharacterized protein YaiL (DUF2058 family)
MRLLVFLPKVVMAGGAAALLLGAGSATAVAAAQAPQPAANVGHAKKAVVVRQAVLEAEASVLGMKPADLRQALKDGQTVEQLATARQLSKAQFGDRFAVALKPRLDALVERGTITRAQGDHILKAIAGGRIPWWNGIHHHAREDVAISSAA